MWNGTVQFSLFISAEHKPGEDLARRLNDHVEQVRLAKQAGFDGVAIGNHMSYGDSAWFPPLETLMRLAPEADGMSLATCMLILPMYHPAHIAQQAALVDIASGGRFTLGVAPGWAKDEFNLLEVDFNRRIGRFKEGVDLIRRFYKGETVRFSGKHYTIEKAKLALQPVRRPPMWFGGSVAAAVSRAAELADTAYGDSWVASSHLTKDVICEQAKLFTNRLRELGKPAASELPLLRNIVVARDRDTAVRDAGPYLAASYKLFGEWGLFQEVVGAKSRQLQFDELLEGRVILGSPEHCAAELLALAHATGTRRIICRIQWLGMPQDIVMRTIEMLGGDVLPMLRRGLA